MSDALKDTTNQNSSNQNSNQNNNQSEQTTKKELNIAELENSTDNLKGKKTDIQNPELWGFPMDYPMSIIGHEGEHESLLNEVKLILGSQFPDFDLASMQVKPSKTGRFHSIRVSLYLTTAEQVNTLYASLDTAKTVRLVM